MPTSGFALILYALAEFLGVARTEYEVVALGSTPKRLDALLAGRCDVTMLNSGNELRAKAAGCHRLAGVSDVCSRYLGTVLAVAGDMHLHSARKLARALATTTDAILDGALDDIAAEEAGAALGLDLELARRYVSGLKDPNDGLVPNGIAGRPELAAVIELRRRYEPNGRNGVDFMAGALHGNSGLVRAEN